MLGNTTKPVESLCWIFQQVKNLLEMDSKPRFDRKQEGIYEKNAIEIDL